MPHGMHRALEGGTHRGLRKGCTRCHAVYMRDWRKTHPESDVERLKGIARATARVYKTRGLLKPKPCERCRSKDVEMHHDDYSKPLKVRWLCRKHHLEHHRKAVSRATHFERRMNWRPQPTEFTQRASPA